MKFFLTFIFIFLISYAAKSNENFKASTCDSIIFVPNSFNGNGDSVNDMFRPVFSSDPAFYELYIFDRWGNVIFKSEEYNKGWNGTTNKGVRVSMDTFVWKIKYKCNEHDEWQQKLGHVTVIR